MDSGSKPLYIADHVKKEAMGERFEDPRWLQTIDQAKFNNAVRYLRIDLGLSRDEFSKLANISCDSLKQIELGKAPASLRVVNRIIQRARLDVDGKAAQLLRLKSQGESPMTIAELATVAPEKLFFYLTIAKGEVQNETAAALERGKGTIYKFAKGQLSLKGTLGKIPEWLGVSTESSLYRLFEQRVLTPNIPANRELVDGVLSEGFVFVDPTRKMPRYRTEVDNILIKELQEKDTVGQALRHLRTRKGLTQPALAGNDHTKSYVGSKEVGPNLPFDYKAGDILKKAGYDIHHPVAHYMINRLSDLRAA